MRNCYNTSFYAVLSPPPCISVRCADNAPMPPAYIFWYHNARMVNYDSGRGVRVQTRGEGDGARTTSRLSLPSASKGDEGNYTCSPSNTDPATVHVFIQEGRLFCVIYKFVFYT